jgi:hypothetical protein
MAPVRYGTASTLPGRAEARTAAKRTAAEESRNPVGSVFRGEADADTARPAAAHRHRIGFTGTMVPHAED